MLDFLKRVSITHECRAARLGLWSCPPFLFLILGFVNVAAMLASYTLSSRFVEEPQVAALIVITVSSMIFVVGTFIIQGFDRIAQANRMKSEFIAIVSHQLRSPLSIFKWTVDAMTRTQHSGPPAVPPGGESDHLNILRENVEKMIQLVNMLLEVSRIDAGRLQLKREAVRLDLATEEIIRSFAPYARASNIALEYAHPADLSPVAGDKDKIKMVIQNLVDNAVRYSHGGGRVAVTIAPIGNSRIEWKIQDTGVGIPEAEQRFVFQKFFRSVHASSHTTEGSGLGLYIARSVITAVDGDMGFSSKEGRGSTFWFRLPIYRA